MKKYLKKGFTIVEMLVIIGVMMMLSGILILYSRSGETASTLIRQSAKIMADINRAKELAITATNFEIAPGQVIRPCGYGVFFEESQYIIFASDSPNCEESLHLRPTDGSFDEEVIPITSSLSIKSRNIQQVFFLSPDPTVLFSTADGSSPYQAEVVLETATGGEIGIRISKAGQVSTF